MPQLIKNNDIVLFAGDTVLTGRGISSIPALSSDLVGAQNWFDNNKLTFNVDKCYTVNLGSGNRFTAVFDGKPNELMKQHKYLGVFIDKERSFNQHVEQVCKNLSRTTGMFFKIGNIFTKSQLLTLYISYLFG